LPPRASGRKIQRVPFEPAFMARRAEFEAELEAVRAPGDWFAFKARWFADQPWPKRSSAALAAARGDGAPLLLAGRTFHRSPLPDDLPPEARHAYFSALARGFLAVFTAASAGAPLRHACPACELYSDEPGPPECPRCARPLLDMPLQPPR
jgi:hypothetical protein